MKIKVVNKSSNVLPEYAHSPIDGKVRDSGLDIRADFSKLNSKYMWNTEMDIQGNLVIRPLGRVLIPTGIHVQLPLGYEFQVRDRSGHALKKGLICANGIGTIDAIYTGDIGVILINCSSEPVKIEDGERIAQLVLCKVETCEWEEVSQLEETDRGNNGYNSTGVK